MSGGHDGYVFSMVSTQDSHGLLLKERIHKGKIIFAGAIINSTLQQEVGNMELNDLSETVGGGGEGGGGEKKIPIALISYTKYKNCRKSNSLADL